MNTQEIELAEFQVGQKVICIDRENCVVEVGVISESHGSGEYDLNTHTGFSISPVCHDGVGSFIHPLQDDVYSYICGLEKHALATGFFNNDEECEDCCDTDCTCTP